MQPTRRMLLNHIEPSIALRMYPARRLRRPPEIALIPIGLQSHTSAYHETSRTRAGPGKAATERTGTIKEHRAAKRHGREESLVEPSPGGTDTVPPDHERNDGETDTVGCRLHQRGLGSAHAVVRQDNLSLKSLA